MIDVHTKRRLVDLTVIATAALVLGGATVLAAHVDGDRRASSNGMATERSQLTGLQRAPKGKRQRVVRRSRAS